MHNPCPRSFRSVAFSSQDNIAGTLLKGFWLFFVLIFSAGFDQELEFLVQFPSAHTASSIRVITGGKFLSPVRIPTSVFIDYFYWHENLIYQLVALVRPEGASFRHQESRADLTPFIVLVSQQCGYRTGVVKSIRIITSIG
jgi:hypothetical protein